MSKVLQRFYPNFSTRYFPLQISVNFVVFVQSFSHSWLFTTPWTVFPVFHYFLEFGQTHVPGGSDDKESACNVGDLGSIPGSGRFPGGGHGNPLQYSCLENSHGQRSLGGYSPWSCKESDTTEQLSSSSSSMYAESVMPSKHLTLSHPLLLSLSLSQHQGLFQCVCSSHQVAKGIGASISASVLPMNIEGWFPLGLTSLISPFSTGLPRVISLQLL